ncbi:MAG: ferric reductase-like transmembrane domain-containing protein [Gammaproteobacteria bacterium]|nr:ferric reductase-like transmembrane domain-containing protein [Gammaproteobacteria bacterium]
MLTRAAARRRCGNPAVIVLVAVPVLAALPAVNGASVATLLHGAGEVAGVAGLALMLLAGALSVRIPGFDRHFGGLTRLWRTHHLLGAGALLLVFAHPLLLAFAAADDSLAGAARTLLPGPQLVAVWLGWAALGAMLVFLAPTFAFFGAPEYQRWKRLHGLAGLALFLGLAHGLALGRGELRWLWAAYGLLALAAYAYRRVLARRFGRLPFGVRELVRRSSAVVEIALVPRERALRYRPGQFIYLTPLDPGLAAGLGEEHPYTLTSAPAETGLRVAVKGLGDASRALQRIAPGSAVQVEGPYGDFFPTAGDTVPELWIAGGIGIAPFIGRLRDLAAGGASADVVLIYCVQDEARADFAGELRDLAARVTGVRLSLHLYCREGALDGRYIDACCPDARHREVYICGPAALAGVARKALRARGVRRARIHTEEFTLL